MNSVILLVAGFFLLVKGADYMVEGSSALAKKFSISEIMIGLTIVAFGTSAPELIVNVLASINKNSGIVFGNIIGSNIFNILLILGISGIIRPIQTEKNTVWKEIPFSLLAAVSILVLGNDLFFNYSANVLSRGDGIILLLFFLIFLSYTFAIPKVESRDGPDVKVMSVLKITFYISIGLVSLFLGGKFVVDNSIFIAQKLGFSEKLIGLTIVSGGTSLPELFTSAMAAKKGKLDLAIGNIVGSNIFNIFFILGLSALIFPVPISASSNTDMWILVFASLLLFLTMFTGKRRSLDRWEAIIFLILYSWYLIFLLFMG